MALGVNDPSNRDLGFARKALFAQVDDDRKDWIRIREADYTVRQSTEIVKDLKADAVTRMLAKLMREDACIEVPDGEGTKSVPITDLAAIHVERNGSGMKDPECKLMPHFAPQFLERVRHEIATGAGAAASQRH